MNRFKLAAAVLNQTPLDWDANQRRIVAVLAAARAQQVGLVCLPELCITGYGCEDAFHGPDVLRQAERVLTELLPETRGLVATVGLPRLHHRALFNTAAVIADGRVLGFVAKQHLAGDGIHYEPRWFKPWREGVVAQTEFAGASLPLGDLLFEVGGVRFGFEICEDAWVAERPGARLAAHGADLILNPSASHVAFGKLNVRRLFVTEGSRAFGCAYVYANLLGNEAGRAIYDGGALIAANGAMLAQGTRLSFQPWQLTTATIDLAAARLIQARTASFTPALNEHPGLVRATHDWPVPDAAAADLPAAPPAAWEISPDLRFEEFTRIEALALWDYLIKSRTEGFVVSLSGGCDSSAVVCLLRLMLARAVRELGLTGSTGVLARLAHIPAVATLTHAVQPVTEAALMRALVTTLYQATAQSSATTRAAAETVAAALDAKHLTLDLTTLVEQYTHTVAAALHRDLTWAHDDLALQNIQARVRAPSAWLVANLENKLLLATSNRSEAAVGYATMDGDTAGGLAPLGGIDKAFLRRWLIWLQTTGPQDFGSMEAIPALACVTEQQSTPELRPATANANAPTASTPQPSETDLMPFDVLDRIERLAIRDKQPPREILLRLREEFPAHATPQLQMWLERFTRLWCRNQWKRERLAPAFHLDDENLDPKTWCRFPILSGGFRRELAEMAPPR